MPGVAGRSGRRPKPTAQGVTTDVTPVREDNPGTVTELVANSLHCRKSQLPQFEEVAPVDLAAQALAGNFSGISSTRMRCPEI